MKEKAKRNYIIFAVSAVVFIAYTLCVALIERKPIGPNGKEVGFATINGKVRDAIGHHEFYYTLTDIGSIVPIGLGIFYGIVGLTQWIKRKSIKKVDFDLIALGVFYALVFSVYLAFEFIQVNYRPVLVDGKVEASYPSSTTVLSLTFLATSIHISNRYLKSEKGKTVAKWLTVAYMAFLVVGRVVSGMHWLTDLIGGGILSVALVSLYYAVVNTPFKKEETEE